MSQKSHQNKSREFSSFGGDLRDLYQDLILDHNKNPRNFKKLENANRTVEGYNPLCGDKVTVYLHLTKGSHPATLGGSEISGENEVIQDISFQGSGCAISKASASIMTTILKGKTKVEAEEIFNTFHRIVTTGESQPEDLGKLAVLAGVHKFPARVKCAILSWHTVVSALEGKEDTVSTE